MALTEQGGPPEVVGTPLGQARSFTSRPLTRRKCVALAGPTRTPKPMARVVAATAMSPFFQRLPAHPASIRHATAGAEDKPGTVSAIIEEMLRAIASDLNPHRPGRSDPRVRKRRPKNHRLLTKHLHEMGPLPHRKTGVENHPEAGLPVPFHPVHKFAVSP